MKVDNKKIFFEMQSQLYACMSEPDKYQPTDKRLCRALLAGIDNDNWKNNRNGDGFSNLSVSVDRCMHSRK
jgi:hypothetical protein